MACAHGAPFIRSGSEWGVDPFIGIAGRAIVLDLGGCGNVGNYGYVNNTIPFRCCVK